MGRIRKALAWTFSVGGDGPSLIRRESSAEQAAREHADLLREQNRLLARSETSVEYDDHRFATADGRIVVDSTEVAGAEVFRVTIDGEDSGTFQSTADLSSVVKLSELRAAALR